MSVLHLQDVAVTEGPFEVVHGITLELSSGEIVALVGPNGSGKSALLRGILGLAPIRGNIAIDGMDLASLSTHQRVRSGLSLCPADHALFPEMSVRENLLMGAFPRGAGHQLEEDLDLIHARLPRLAERWNLMAGRLSGGEQRLLAVAKTLMARSKFLLLAEPTAGLAPGFRSAVEELARGGLTGPPPGVLLADQDLDLVINLASRLLVFLSGRIVEEVRPAEVPNLTELRQRLDELV